MQNQNKQQNVNNRKNKTKKQIQLVVPYYRSILLGNYHIETKRETYEQNDGSKEEKQILSNHLNRHPKNVYFSNILLEVF